jgi:hypothetical protein
LNDPALFCTRTGRPLVAGNIHRAFCSITKAASEAVNAPHLVPLVRPGAVFKNGKLITRLIPSV